MPECRQRATVGDHRLGFHAVQLTHAVTDKGVLACAVMEQGQAKHDTRHLRRDEPEVFFTGAQRGLGLLARGDVLHHGRVLDSSPVFHGNPSAKQHANFATSGGHQLCFQLGFCLAWATDRSADDVLGFLCCFRCKKLHERADGRCVQIGRRVQHSENFVGPEHPVGGEVDLPSADFGNGLGCLEQRVQATAVLFNLGITGDVGKGTDEATGGQRFGLDLHDTAASCGACVIARQLFARRVVDVQLQIGRGVFKI